MTMGALLSLLLGACHSAVENAARDEAMYDRAMEQHQYVYALQQINAAIALNDTEPRYWLKLARANLALPDYTQAYGAYNQVIALQPDNVEALQALAQIALLSNDIASAKRFVETLMVLVPQDVRGRLVQATIALREGRYADCSALVASLEQENENSDDLSILKAELLAATGKSAEAGTVLEKRLSGSDQKARILSTLIKIYQQQDNKTGIESAYQRLSAAQPGDPNVGLPYARLLYRDGKTTDARAVVAALEAKNAGNGDVALQIAQFWSDAAPPEVARPQMLRIANQGGLLRKAAIGTRLIEIGQPHAAYGLLAPLVGAAPVDAENIFAQVAYADALRAIGRAPDARTRVDQALAFDKTNAPALQLRAELALAAHDLNQALSDGQLLVSVEPKSERGAILLAQIYAARGNRTLAEQSFSRALSDFPDSMAVLRADLVYLTAAGRISDAARLATRFANDHPRSAEAQAIRSQVCEKAGKGACADDGFDAVYTSAPAAPPPAQNRHGFRR